MRAAICGVGKRPGAGGGCAALAVCGRGGKVVVQPLVFNRVMDIVPVSGWQVAQQADDVLVVLLTGGRDGLANEALIDQLTRSLAQEGVRVPSIQVQRVSAIPKTVSGKAPLIKAHRA